ncbi:MAG TPA: hypothetical protein VLX31_07560 [Streptosporangiaceae bacterium]|nr:hypothetical protein [Streptosporangiaceae bacterium]
MTQASVVFPAGPDGRRSTSAFGRAVVADALRGTDPAGALGAEQETNWRSGYLTHFRRLIEAGLTSTDAALSIAGDGLESVHRRMRAVLADGSETGIDDLLTTPAGDGLRTVAVRGTAEPGTELALPYRGSVLRGDELLRRLDAWVSAGIIEPSCADAVGAVAAHPEWLSLPGRTVAALGAGSEIGPLPVLLRWGATAAGIDLPGQRLWERVLDMARAGAGTLLVPVSNGQRAETGTGAEAGSPAEEDPAASEGSAGLARSAGTDLNAAVPELADWLAGLGGGLVLGNYVYADGAANLAVCAAADTLTLRLAAARPDLAIAFLATPTDVFAVPADAVRQSVRAYEQRPMAVKLAVRPLRALSGGRLLRRAYVPGADPGISDCLVAQQGPNYALAKRLQRWRACVARQAGMTVSLNVAPPTRTRSVVRNRVLAAAYAGAHRFGAEVFEPDTCRVLMAALLVHDLCAGSAAGTESGPGPEGGPGQGPGSIRQPWQDEAYAAAHGGLWRIAYAPRSALGLAALLGYGSARS